LLSWVLSTRCIESWKRVNDSKLLLLLGDGNNLNYYTDIHELMADKKKPFPLYEYLDDYYLGSWAFSKANSLVKKWVNRDKKETGMSKKKLFVARKDCKTPQCTEDNSDNLLNNLIFEAYERKTVALRVSHILIKLDSNSAPPDTLDAYNKILTARERVLNGEPFSKLAKDISDDPSARDTYSNRNNKSIPGNGGDLGYFTLFDMVYPFETGAYSTDVGEISMPIRSKLGYHIIYVTDKIPALGSIEAAHLFMKIPDNANQKDSLDIYSKINSIYNQIQSGESFEELVKQYSDDKTTASKGGLLPKFNVNQMTPEFIYAISTLEFKGDITPPILTNYGWHIIKLISKSGVGIYDEEYEGILTRIKTESRY